MTTEGPDDAFKKMLDGLSEALRKIKEREAREQELAETTDAALDYAEAHGGIIIPIAVGHGNVPEVHVDLLHGLMSEQSKASLFFGQLPEDHGYREVFRALTEAWNQAAMIGALQIAKHEVEHHDGEGGVGPREFSAAWSAIATTAVLGAIRYGQEHPDAFKGLEGLKEGEIDETVAALIAWAAEQVAQQPDEPKEEES